MRNSRLIHFNKTKYSLRSLLRWLYAHSKGCRLQAAMNGAIGLALVAFGLWSVDTFRTLTDIATGAREGSILATGAVLIAIFVCELALRCAQTWVSSVLGVRTQNAMQSRFFRHLLHGKWNGIERLHSGDVMNRLFGDVNDIVSLMTEVVPLFLTVSVQFAASFIYLYRMDSKLAVIIVIATPAFILLSRLYFHRMRRIVRHVKDSNSALQAIIQECVQHKMVIKVLEREQSMADKLERRQSLLHRQTKARARLSIFTKVFITIGFTGAYLVGFVMGLLQLQEGLITVGVLMAFTQLIHRIQRPLLDIARLIPVFVNSLTSAERLMELEELPTEKPHSALAVNKANTHSAMSANAPAASLKTSNILPGGIGVRFQGATYQYSDTGRKVLNGFSHTFQPGSFTAILGDTGVGKTTLLRMILALIAPNEGKAEMFVANIAPASESNLQSGGNDSSESNSLQSGVNNSSNETVIPITPSVRSLISYIPQGNTLFSGTIRENLLLGNPEATTDDMRRALHIAQADFVFDLPDGLYTACGENGGGLSEGQAQRIAIARAILRPCRLMLLDEATSALDMNTEKQLLQNLKQHFADTTIIFVTHRLAVVDFTTDVITMQRSN